MTSEDARNDASAISPSASEMAARIYDAQDIAPLRPSVRSAIASTLRRQALPVLICSGDSVWVNLCDQAGLCPVSVHLTERHGLAAVWVTIQNGLQVSVPLGVDATGDPIATAAQTLAGRVRRQLPMVLAPIRGLMSREPADRFERDRTVVSDLEILPRHLRDLGTTATVNPTGPARRVTSVAGHPRRPMRAHPTIAINVMLGASETVTDEVAVRRVARLELDAQSPARLLIGGVACSFPTDLLPGDPGAELCARLLSALEALDARIDASLHPEDLAQLPPHRAR